MARRPRAAHDPFLFDPQLILKNTLEYGPHIKLGLVLLHFLVLTLDGATGLNKEAPPLNSEHKGMASMVCAKVQENGGEAVKMHCIMHQEAVCAQTVQLSNV